MRAGHLFFGINQLRHLFHGGTCGPSRSGHDSLLKAITGSDCHEARTIGLDCAWHHAASGAGSQPRNEAAPNQERKPLHVVPFGQHIVPLDTFPGAAYFVDNPSKPGLEKTAAYLPGWQTRRCMIKTALVTIRKDGTSSWFAEVLSVGDDDAYGVGLHFFDHNNLQLFEMPRIWSPTLNINYQNWERDNLAIPGNIYPYITFVTRSDHC